VTGIPCPRGCCCTLGAAGETRSAYRRSGGKKTAPVRSRTVWGQPLPRRVAVHVAQGEEVAVFLITHRDSAVAVDFGAEEMAMMRTVGGQSHCRRNPDRICENGG
jgi:hypothetical protein